MSALFQAQNDCLLKRNKYRFERYPFSNRLSPVKSAINTIFRLALHLSWSTTLDSTPPTWSALSRSKWNVSAAQSENTAKFTGEAHTPLQPYAWCVVFHFPQSSRDLSWFVKLTLVCGEMVWLSRKKARLIRPCHVMTTTQRRATACGFSFSYNGTFRLLHSFIPHLYASIHS